MFIVKIYCEMIVALRIATGGIARETRGEKRKAFFGDHTIGG